MPDSRETQVYHIAMINDMEATDEYCSKTTRKIIKYAFCFIPWCCLLIIFGYFLLNYDMLYQTQVQCNSTLHAKNINDSVMQAKLGDLKQKNIKLKEDVNELERNLELEKEKFKNAQAKIAIYVKAINELKENLNLKISTEYINSGAARHTCMFYHFIILSFILSLI